MQSINRLTKVDIEQWELLFYVVAFVYATTLVVISFDYSPAARLFPLVVGTTLIVLILAKVALLLLSRWGGYAGGGLFEDLGPDFGEAGESDDWLPPVERYTRQLQMVGWMVLLLVSIWAVGFQLTMVPFVLLFVYFYERDWRKAVVASLVTLVLVYVIFIQILSAALWEGVFL